MYPVYYKGYIIFHNGNILGKKGKLLKFSKDKGGYQIFSLYDNGKKSTEKVHRIIATCFLQNCDNRPEVNHIDGNKENNHINNLEWVTKSENVRHAYNTGLMENVRNIVGENGRKTLIKILSKKVVDLKTGLVYDSAKQVSERFNINQTTLCHWLSGYRKNKSSFKYL